MTDVTKGTVVSKQGTGNDTLSVTCNGINRLLLVFIDIVDLTPASRILTIDYNGDSMTRQQGRNWSSNNAETEVWILLAPASGANTLTYTFAGSIIEYQIVAIPLANVDQSNPVDVGNGASGTSISNTVNVTTTVDRCQLYSCLAASSNVSSVTPGIGETIIKFEVDANAELYASQKNVVVGIGNSSMNWSWTSSEAFGHEVVAIAPFVGVEAVGAPIFF